MGIIIYFHNVVTHFGARYKQKIQKNTKKSKNIRGKYIYISEKSIIQRSENC
jgi:hypothetical protein